MAKAALAFAAGFGTGYLNQTRQNKLDAERQEDRDMRKQEFADQQEERDRLKRNRTSMAQAGELRETNTEGAVVDGLSTKPVLYEDANVASGDLRQDRRLREASAQTAQTADPTGPGPGLGMQLPATPPEEVQDSTSIGPGSAAPVAAAPAPAPAPTMRKAISSGGQEYATREEADAATKKYNDGRGERISQELYRQGEPGKAMQMDAGTMELQEKKRSHAQKMLDEGAEQVATASRKGDPEAVRAAANAKGDYKIDGEIRVTPEKRNVPGLGEIPTYNYTFNAIGKDGKPREMSFNSHDLSMQTLQFKEVLDVGFKGRAADDKSAYNAQVAEARMKAAEAAEIRAGIYGGGAGRGTGTGGKAAGSPVDSAQKLLEEQLGKPDGTPEMAQRNTKALQSLDGVYKSHPELSPRTAAFIAADVASDPKTKLRPQLDHKTGMISQVYQNPEIEQGKTYVIALNSGSIKDIETAYGKDGVKTAVQGVLSTMGAPERQASFLRAAHDPSYRKTMEAAAEAQGFDMTVLRRKIDLLKALPNPGADNKGGSTNAVTDKPSLTKSGFGVNYTPPAGSPAAKAQAARTQAAAQAQAKADKAGEAQQMLSKQFQADSKTLAPLELVRKYDALRTQLPTSDAAALQAFERQL